MSAGRVITLIALLYSGVLAAASEEPHADSSALISGSISDGTPPPPAPERELPDFVVKSTVVRLVDVVEAPPMPGLPPVSGTITETVHLVEDPGLPDPPVPPPPAPLGPEELARLVEFTKDDSPSQLIFLSATVYDHSRTLLRCFPGGNAKKEITAWSNIDFNHFGGFSSFSITGADGTIRHYDLLMGVGNEDTAARGKFLAEHGVDYEAPEIPELPDGPLAYVIDTQSPDPEGLQLIADLHELYRNEGARMAAAYAARIEAEEQRRADLLANPPVPEDVTVHFWKRSHPVGMAAETVEPGGSE